MEAPEVPLDGLQEQVEEKAHESEHGQHRREKAEPQWNRWIALSTALIAALAALGSLLAGHTETEAMDCKMDANDTWTYFGTTSLKAHSITETQIVLAALGKAPDAGLAGDLASYKEQKTKLQRKATEYTKASELYLTAHTRYGYAVTMFQVAIALAAIAALTGRRRYWLISLGLGLVGIAFACLGASCQGSIAVPVEEEDSSAVAHAGSILPGLTNGSAP